MELLKGRRPGAENPRLDRIALRARIGGGSRSLERNNSAWGFSPRWTVALAALLLSLLAVSASAQEEAGEYEVKAAFLYNFAKFVEWPGNAFGSPTDPLVLCVYGDDPFGESLDAVIQGEKVGGRRLVVHRTREIPQLRGCHVVFLSQRARERYPEVLGSLRGRSVLTVGEGDGFLADGGMIRFVLEQNRVRFEINLDAAERHRLKLSSQLLRLARTVNPQQGRP